MYLIKNKFIKFAWLFFIGLILAVPLFNAWAANSSNFKNPLDSDSFSEIAESIIEWIVNIGVLIAVIMIIYSGILFMASRGDDENITKAKKALMWSLIGLAILLIGKSWISIIESLL
jgi:energy-coupling factor transporter transmembrane protein EcfT